jgi:serine O-acetyltransferase
VKLLTDQFESVEAGEPPRGLLSDLRMDMRAKAVWYHGRATRGLALRMLFSDGSLCTVLYRLMRALRQAGLGPLAAAAYKLNALFTRAVIGRGAELGPGLVILHSVGVVINTSVHGGANVVIEGGATIGAEKAKSPALGDNVFIGAGARVIGGVHVGSGARIGANAVVTRDVPPGVTAVGVPARILRRGDEDE